MFLKRKVGVTERPRVLNPSKAIAMITCPIIVHFSTLRARSMHDVACKFARAAVRCAVRTRRNNWRERTLRKLPLLLPHIWGLYSTIV